MQVYSIYISQYKIYQNIYQSLEIDDILQHKTQSSTQQALYISHKLNEGMNWLHAIGNVNRQLGHSSSKYKSQHSPTLNYSSTTLADMELADSLHISK